MASATNARTLPIGNKESWQWLRPITDRLRKSLIGRIDGLKPLDRLKVPKPFDLVERSAPSDSENRVHVGLKAMVSTSSQVFGANEQISRTALAAVLDQDRAILETGPSGLLI